MGLKSHKNRNYDIPLKIDNLMYKNMPMSELHTAPALSRFAAFFFEPQILGPKNLLDPSLFWLKHLFGPNTSLVPISIFMTKIS